MGGLSLEEMNAWRIDAKHKLNTAAYMSGSCIKIINPVDFYNFEVKRYQTEKEVEDFDLYHVTSSNIIIVNLDGLDGSIGTIIELHDACYHHKIPVVAFGDKSLYDALHPWIKNDITRVEDSIDTVIDYIKDFYFI